MEEYQAIFDRERAEPCKELTLTDETLVAGIPWKDLKATAMTDKYYESKWFVHIKDDSEFELLGKLKGLQEQQGDMKALGAFETTVIDSVINYHEYMEKPKHSPRASSYDIDTQMEVNDDSADRVDKDNDKALTRADYLRYLEQLRATK